MLTTYNINPNHNANPTVGFSFVPPQNLSAKISHKSKLTLGMMQVIPSG